MEVKRVEQLNIFDAITQAKRDAKNGMTPMVAHRKNNTEWLVTMRGEDWVHMALIVEEATLLCVENGYEQPN